MCPIEGIGTILWWIIDEMVNKSDPYGSAWWEFTPTSLINIITQVCGITHDIQDIFACEMDSYTSKIQYRMHGYQ